MEKTPLKDWFKFQIWPQSGGSSPELRDLSEIRQWLIDTANDPELLASITQLQVIVTDPNLTRKLETMKNGTDNVSEILYNKFLKTPYVNDPSCDRAEIELPGNATGHILIQAIGLGTAGNAYTVNIEAPEAPNSAASFSANSSGEIVITLAGDADGVACTTFSEAQAGLEAIADFNALFRCYPVSNNELNGTELLLATDGAQNLSGGENGNPLTSSGSDIDKAVATASTDGSPAMAAAASATLTASGAITNGKIVVVNNRTYTFVTALSADPTVPNEILIGADEDASMTNLTAAINGSAGEGTAYSVLTQQPTDVTAVFNTESDTIVILTAGTKGSAGDAYPLSSNDANITVPEDGFTGGVDGTVAVAGAIRVGDNKIWAATTDTTITDSSGWKSVSLT